MSRGIVLVTGINGFLGTYTALAFLEAGYTVRGTARTLEKAQGWIAHFPAHKAVYQPAVVADLAAPGAFDDAVMGCDIIVHVASPNTREISDNEVDVLIPAIRGMRNLLHATKKEPRIRRVVFTSTPVAVVDTTRFDPGKVYTAQDWNPSTYAEAKASPDPRVVYGTSKALAERAFWDYIKDEKPTWAGATILPCAVFDPPIQPLSSLATLNRSVAFIRDIVGGKYKAGLDLHPAHAYFISARDVAQAHLRAAERDEARNQRHLLVGGSWDMAELMDIVNRNFPALSVNLPASPEAAPPVVGLETAKTKTDLGMEFMPFEKVIVDTIGALLVLETQFGASGTEARKAE
ncbi:NAD-P-binding protein [Mycena latifolia]|nr:NAD-P-binding protein [Mycena latifolia]